MSRTETAVKPLIENSSSAAARIASRRFDLRDAASLGADLSTMSFVRMYKRRGPVNKKFVHWSGADLPRSIRGLPRPLRQEYGLRAPPRAAAREPCPLAAPHRIS